MSYYFHKTIQNKSFEEAIEVVTSALQKEGFGVLTEIDVSATLKKKINVDYKKYRILGACNPTFAHQALLIDSKAGVFLPCNVIVEEKENDVIEVSAVDPVASMVSIENDALTKLLHEVREKLIDVIDNL